MCCISSLHTTQHSQLHVGQTEDQTSFLLNLKQLANSMQFPTPLQHLVLCVAYVCIYMQLHIYFICSPVKPCCSLVLNTSCVCQSDHVILICYQCDRPCFRCYNNPAVDDVQEIKHAGFSISSYSYLEHDHDVLYAYKVQLASQLASSYIVTF